MMIAINECPYIPLCQEEFTLNYKNCEIYEFIEYLLNRQNRISRVAKRIHRQEHGHRNYEPIKVTKDVDIGKIIELILNENDIKKLKEMLSSKHLLMQNKPKVVR